MQINGTQYCRILILGSRLKRQAMQLQVNGIRQLFMRFGMRFQCEKSETVSLAMDGQGICEFFCGVCIKYVVNYLCITL